MSWAYSFNANEKLYLRDPQDSDLGRRILRTGMELMHAMGLEDFTMKKLAQAMQTNESSLYRYFENKNRLLQYYFEWYWRWLDSQVFILTQNVDSPRQRLDTVVDVITAQRKATPTEEYWLEGNLLRNLIVKDGDKAYLTSRVDEDNQLQLFRPYKELCGKIAAIVSELEPAYPFPRSLASTLLEMAHHQIFFMEHLPSLTDFGHSKEEEKIAQFLKDLVGRLGRG
ncbi:MAG: TetR/AcrR family transcriptional regulator [Sphingobacteriaceae bacterium]|nr:TetR/AcrR family transcriptional regulator [Cytophagaceae bacterium]